MSLPRFSQALILLEGQGQKANSHHFAPAFKWGWNKAWLQYNNKSGTSRGGAQGAAYKITTNGGKEGEDKA